MAGNNRFMITVICGSLLISGTLLFFLFRPGGVLSRTTAAHALSYLMNMNSVKVSLSEGLDPGKVSVTWDESTVVDHGRMNREGLNRERYGYGNNFFRVFYETQEIAGFVQYKFNNWHYHAYHFHLNRQDGRIHVTLGISGPDNNITQLSDE